MIPSFVRHTARCGHRRPGRPAFALALVTLLGLAPASAQASQRPQLRLLHDAEERELVLELGPIHLPANAGHGDVAQPPPRRAVVPVTGWLHGYRVEIVGPGGDTLPSRLLHHVNVIAPQRRELFSPIMQRIAAAGQETAPVKLPRLFGVPLEQGETLLVASMWHNPTARNYPGATLRVRMSYTPEDTWLPPLSVQPFYMDVMPPASGHAYDLPPGRSARRWEGSPAIGGRILGLGGHLHEHAVALRLEDVTAGEILWEARPITDDRGEVVGMPQEVFWFGKPLRRDHTYRLTAFYDNPTGRTIPLGGMGALGGVVLPARGEEWPSVDRSDPEYRLDLRLVTEGAYRDHGEHAHGQ